MHRALFEHFDKDVYQHQRLSLAEQHEIQEKIQKLASQQC